MRIGLRKLLRTGLVSAIAWDAGSGCCTQGKVKLEEADGSSRQDGVDFAFLVLGGA